jgi:riboflavin synthase
MFTGLIEHVGTVHSAKRGKNGLRLEVALGPLADGVRIGDSIAVSGACLTVSALERGLAAFDVSAETQRKTTIGGWRAGRSVNLERALTLGARLGGHLVSGHVDGVGRLVERRAERGGERFVVALPTAVRAVEKGSIAIDGTSLTTWECRRGRCAIAVIPHTLAATTLGTLRRGDTVNCEQDLIGRWVESLAKPWR